MTGLVLGVVLAVGACTRPPEPPGPPDGALFPVPSAEPFPEPTTDALQGLLDAWVDENNGVGVTAAVVAAHGTWAGTSGVDGADRTLVPEAAMAVGSVTQTFVAAQVLLLADAGRVDLAAPVADHVALPFDARGASVRQVLTMRSGFPVDPVPRLVELVAADPDRSWSPEEHLAAADPRGPRAGQLGGAQFPNGLNYVVLGMLVEEVTGEPLAGVLRRDLIDPAALERVWVQDDERPVPPLAAGEGDRSGVVDPGGAYLPSRAAASVLGASGGMAADAPSLARWGYLLYGGHVLDPELVRRMTTREGGGDYGYGTLLSEVEGEPVVGQVGGTPGFHAVLQVLPARAAAVAVLVPGTAGMHLGTGVDAGELATRLHRVVAGAQR